MAIDRDLHADLVRLEALVDSGDAVRAHQGYWAVRVMVEGHRCPEHWFHLHLIDAKLAAAEGEYKKAVDIGESLLQACRASDNRH